MYFIMPAKEAESPINRLLAAVDPDPEVAARRLYAIGGNFLSRTQGLRDERVVDELIEAAYRHMQEDPPASDPSVFEFLESVRHATIRRAGRRQELAQTREYERFEDPQIRERLDYLFSRVPEEELRLVAWKTAGHFKRQNEADDFYHEALMYFSRKDRQDIENPKAYFRGIVRYRIFNALEEKRLKRIRTASVEMRFEPHTRESTPPEDPSDVENILNVVYAYLPEDQADAVFWVAQDLNLKEAGELVGASHAALNGRIASARKNARKLRLDERILGERLPAKEKRVQQRFGDNSLAYYWEHYDGLYPGELKKVNEGLYYRLKDDDNLKYLVKFDELKRAGIDLKRRKKEMKKRFPKL